MDTVLFVFEIIGTVVFAISGAVVGMKKGMDMFGVCVMGFTTATTGGIVRDLILGITPPTVFREPIYAAVAVVSSILVFIPFVQHEMIREKKIFDIIILIADSAGLGVFSVVGVQCALENGREWGLFLAVFVGTLTGVGGSILRDMFAGNTPYIFVKHFYACASMMGALTCALLWDITGNILAMIIGAVITFLLRILAAVFHWHLPKYKGQII
ncbi:MAG: trimeric intracellular cation channel family protein [Eubacteriales bacterium]|nr:trimeric intracellular cation channel family protein [Eubacteriales bacterium]